MWERLYQQTYMHRIGRIPPRAYLAHPFLLPRSPEEPPIASNLTFNPAPNLAPNPTPVPTQRSKPCWLSQTQPNPAISTHCSSAVLLFSHSQYPEWEEPSLNVYINGRPPHFPESELWVFAKPFREVKSVWSFTRWVGGQVSGYGFISMFFRPLYLLHTQWPFAYQGSIPISSVENAEWIHTCWDEDLAGTCWWVKEAQG